VIEVTNDVWHSSPNSVQITAGPGSIWSSHVGESYTGEIWHRMYVKGSLESTAAGSAWSLEIQGGASDNSMGRWYGGATGIRPRIRGTGRVLNPVALTGGWDLCEVKIMPGTGNDGYSEFFFNGVSLGTLQWGDLDGGQDSQAVDVVRINRWDRSDMSGVACWVDDMSLTPEPTTLVLLGLGGLISLRRRA